MANSPHDYRSRGVRLFVLILGGIAFFFGLWATLNNFSGGSVPRWSAAETAIFVGLNAFGCATIIGETIPIVVPRTAAWSNAKHFTIVGVIFAGLFALQYSGVRMAIGSHVGLSSRGDR